MMQYCKFCAFCFDGGDDFRCSDHPKGLQPHWTQEQISRPNHCPNFAESELGDVLTGRKYQPRKQAVNNAIKGQIRMEGI